MLYPCVAPLMMSPCPFQDKLLTMDPKEITYEMVNKKLQEIVLSRGKKGIDRQDQVEMLSYLATVAKGPYQKVRCSRTLFSSGMHHASVVAEHLKVGSQLSGLNAKDPLHEVEPPGTASEQALS